MTPKNANPSQETSDSPAEVGPAEPKPPLKPQNTEGLTGQGSESALAHLRNLEQIRADQPDGNG